MNRSEKWFYVDLEVAFLAIAAGMAYFGNVPEIPASVFPFVLGAAAFRIGRSVSENLVFKWFRDWVGIVEKADSSGAGNSGSVASGVSGKKRAFAELICCPVCSGTWGAVALLAAVSVIPEFGRGLVLIFGAAGIGELILWISEFYGWRGRQAREVSGSYWMAKNPVEAEENGLYSGGFVVVPGTSVNEAAEVIE